MKPAGSRQGSERAASRRRCHTASNAGSRADVVRGNRFERLLSDLSGGVVATLVEHVDSHIEDGLRQLVEFLDVDCAAVVQTSPNGHVLHVTHSYSRTALATIPVIVRDSEFPWLAKQVRQGRIVRLQRLPEELPPEADAECRFMTATCLRSCVMVPFTIAGSTPGALGFGAHRPRSWTNTLIMRLRLVAEVLASALTRGQEQRDLLERLSFEQLITDLVRSLVSTSSDQTNAKIQAGLERVIGHFGVDRTGLGRFAKDGSIEVTHSARRTGVPAGPARIDMAWYVAELGQGHIVEINDVSTDLPVHAVAERTSLGETGLRAFLAIPLEVGGYVWGAISFAAFYQPRRWTDEEAQRLRLLGQIMMNALLRGEGAETVRRQQDEVAHAARVGALGELTAALTHELNQPLAAIQTNAQTMRRLLAAGPPDDLDQICDDIIGDATRAGDLVHRVRDLLRKRAGGMRSLSVNEVIEDLRALVETEARRHGARLVLGLTPDRTRILGNAAQLQQVLMSLVRNAAEAMIEIEPERREVTIRTFASSPDELIVSIEDRGRPLSKRSLEHFFTPFHTAKPGGVGTGLAISRSIIQAHGGRLWAERRPEAGLVVSFALPAQRDVSDEPDTRGIRRR
jgi:signal transduction histidine kinase